MDNNIVINAHGLGKCYQIYARPVDRLKQSLWRHKKKFYREFWALRDINLQVKQGETLGIIGSNGSGKTTLLQMICGTLWPTVGHVSVRGRIAALLELGAGFNPEFTGRENVYMNAAVMGLNRKEVDSRFDDTAEFADIGQFMEQPVKVYSSGMYLRLSMCRRTFWWLMRHWPWGTPVFNRSVFQRSGNSAREEPCCLSPTTVVW